MKKCCALLLMMSLLLPFFCGCRSGAQGEDALIEGLKEILSSDLSGCEILYFDQLNAEKREERLVSLYRCESLPQELMSVSNGLLILSLRDDGFEVQLLKVRHRSDRPAAELLLRRRLDYLQSSEMRRYLADGYQNYLASAAVYCYGNWVMLLATGENDLCYNELKNLL